MSRYDRVAGMIDQAVALWSPRTAMRRVLDRERLRDIDQIREQYAAAKSNRLTGTWSPLNENVNSIIEASSAPVRARIRQLVRDFPVLSNAIHKIEHYTVGSGIQLQSRVRAGSNGSETYDDNAIRQIETGWERWKGEADVAGKLHLDEMAALAKRQDAECGEFLVVKTRSKKRGRFLPLALQIVEPDWLTDLNTTPANSNNLVSQGIEYDPVTGAVAAYNLASPDGYLGDWSGRYRNAIRYPADQVIHGFETVRPGQLRGISALAAAVMLAKDIDEMMQSELDASKMAAKYLSFVTTPDPLSRQNALMDTDEDTGQKIEEMENAIIEYLRPGEQITLASNPRPGANFEPFIRMCIRMMALSTGIPYEILSGDYSGLNFSTMRVGRNDFVMDLDPMQTRHIRQFYAPIFHAFLDDLVLSGRAYIPGYWLDPYRYQRAEWYPPVVQSADPLKDMKVDIEGIKAGLVSPYVVAKARGMDAEEVLRDLKKFQDKANELGVELDLGGISTAQQQNPAAVMKMEPEEGEFDA